MNTQHSKGGHQTGLNEDAVKNHENPEVGKGKEIDDKTLSGGHSSDISDPGKKIDGKRADEHQNTLEGLPESNMAGAKIASGEENKVPLGGLSDAAQVEHQPVAGTGSEATELDPTLFHAAAGECNAEPTEKKSEHDDDDQDEEDNHITSKHNDHSQK